MKRPKLTIKDIIEGFSISRYTGIKIMSTDRNIYYCKNIYVTDGIIVLRINPGIVDTGSVDLVPDIDLIERTEDIFSEVKIEKEIKYFFHDIHPVMEECEHCNGTGQMNLCLKCEGDGEYPCGECGQDRECEVCNGEGFVGGGVGAVVKKCEFCFGSGKVEVPINVYLQEKPYPILVDGRYLIKIFNHFQNVKLYSTGGSSAPVYFKFKFGDGLLMPMCQ